MKNASIFHGTSGTPNSFWFPYLKSELQKKKYKVWVPQLPGTDMPDLQRQLPFVLKNGEYNKDSVIIGHSSGSPLILSLLENLSTKIRQAILVAGFLKPLDEDPEPILQDKYIWKKIKQNSQEFIFINSNNDPWGCNDKAGRKMLEHLGGTLIIPHNQGHMGSDKFNQPYKKFPLLAKLIE